MFKFSHDLDFHQQVDFFLAGVEINIFYGCVISGFLVNGLVNHATRTGPKFATKSVHAGDGRRVTQLGHDRHGLVVAQQRNVAIGLAGGAVVHAAGLFD